MTNVRAMFAGIIAVVVALITLPACAAGRFVYVDGSVIVRGADGVARAVRHGDVVNVSDSIVVVDGRAQVRFDDGAWTSLEPGTIFSVIEYARQESDDIVLSLLKGSARVVTGLFTNRAPQRYRFVTPVATIGIRGTSFQVTYCVQSCDLPDGLYVTGGDGTIYVKNDFGEIDLTRGQTAYVSDAQTAPRLSEIKPLAAIPEPMTAQQISVAGQATTTELRPGNFVYFAGTNGYTTPFQPISVTSGGLGFAGSGTVSGDAAGVIDGISQSGTGSAAGAGINAGAGALLSGNSLTVVLDDAQRLVSFTATSSTGQLISGTALSPPELTSSDGILFWGRWTNTNFQFDVTDPVRGTATGSGALPAGSYIHYIAGLPVASIPLSGTASYSFIGGTGSTSLAGTVGAGVTAGSLTANFGTNFVSTNLTISHSGTLAATGAGFLSSTNRASFSSIFGSASGSTGTFPFAFNGFFAGPGAPSAPARAGMVWKVDLPDPIVGTAGFSCSSGC